jgi:hypothetical protein
MADEKRRVGFEGRWEQSQFDQAVLDHQIDPDTVYFLRDSRRIYVGTECFNVSSAAFGGIPVEYTTQLSDGTLEKRAFSEDGDEWRLTFFEKKPDDVDFQPRHTFEFAIEESEDGTELGVIRIDNRNVGFSNAHAVFCEDIDQVILGIKTFEGDIRVPDVPRIGASATNKDYVTKSLGELHEVVKAEARDETTRVDSEIGRLDAKDQELNQRITNEVKTLNKRVDVEVETLNVKINQEAATRERNDVVLQEHIDAESKRAMSREDDLQSQLDTEIQSRIEDVDDEETRATEKEDWLDAKIDSATAELKADDVDYDSKVIHIAGSETVEGQKTFLQPVIGSIDTLTTPRKIRVDLSKLTDTLFDGSSDVVVPVEGITSIENGGTARPYHNVVLHTETVQALEVEEVDYPNTPAEARRQYVKVPFDIDVVTKGEWKDTQRGTPRDKDPTAGLHFEKIENGFAFYVKSADVRNQTLVQQTIIPIKLTIAYGGVEYVDEFDLSLNVMWGQRQLWKKGDWGYRLDSQDDATEFYDVPQIEQLLQNVEDLGVVDSAFDPRIEYRHVIDVTVDSTKKGAGFERGDLLVLKLPPEDRWADFAHARAYVEAVDAAGGILAVSLQYSGLYSMNHNFDTVEVYTNTSRTDGNVGREAILHVTTAQKYGKTLEQLSNGDGTVAPGRVIKPGMMVTVLRDETLTPISAQRYKYFDENRDGKPEWHPWTPYKVSRDYRGDGEYVTVDNSETAAGRLVTLNPIVKDRIDHAAQDDKPTEITATWTFNANQLFEKDVTIRGVTTVIPPVNASDASTKKYVDDEVTKERTRATTAEGDLQYTHVTKGLNLTKAIDAEGTRAIAAEKALQDRATNLEGKVVQSDMAGATTTLREVTDKIVSKKYLEETKTDVLEKMTLHETPSIHPYYPGNNLAYADVKVTKNDGTGAPAQSELGVDGKPIETAPDFRDNQTVEIETTVGIQGLRVKKGSIREQHFTQSVYRWINRKIELSNLTRVRDDDLVFMETDSLGHRVETNQRPWELDASGDYGNDGQGTLQVDWIKRQDLVLKRLDQTIQGVKDFTGEDYSKYIGYGLEHDHISNGDYDGENAIQVPSKITDVFTTAKVKTDARYGEKRNAATEYQVYRLLFDAFSDDGEDGTLGRTDINVTQDDGQVLRTYGDVHPLPEMEKKPDQTTGKLPDKLIEINLGNVHPQVEDLDTNFDDWYETGYNRLFTYHDMLKRTTYSWSESLYTDDLGIFPVKRGDHYDVRITGKHLLNKDQNKDEDVNGIKTFTGQFQLADDTATSKSAIFEKPVDITSVREAVQDNGDAKPTELTNPALKVTGGVNVGKDIWFVKGKDQKLFDDGRAEDELIGSKTLAQIIAGDIDDTVGNPIGYEPSANRYATERQVYNTIKEMAIVIVQELERVRKDLTGQTRIQGETVGRSLADIMGSDATHQDSLWTSREKIVAETLASRNAIMGDTSSTIKATISEVAGFKLANHNDISTLTTQNRADLTLIDTDIKDQGGKIIAKINDTSTAEITAISGVTAAVNTQGGIIDEKISDDGALTRTSIGGVTTAVSGVSTLLEEPLVTKLATHSSAVIRGITGASAAGNDGKTLKSILDVNTPAGSSVTIGNPNTNPAQVHIVSSAAVVIEA